MVFSPIPIYLDPPNWQQQPNDQNPHHLPPLPQPTAPQAGPPFQLDGTGLTTAHVRPNSMVERARLAKIPLPEAPLKCPRCDSTNTKFCYFNNYSLSQPRHFCKSCRRYWTRGGALRNVPVGGGCRRNKRTKSNGGSNTRSKSTVVVSPDQQASTSSSRQNYTNPNKILNAGQMANLTSNLPILPPLQCLGDYNSNGIGLDFDGSQINYSIGNISSGELVDQWRSSSQQVQQFPFLMNSAGLGQSLNVLYPLMEGNEDFNHDQAADYDNQLSSKPLMDHMPEVDENSVNVKAEENDHQGLNNPSKNFLGNIGMNSANAQFSWGGSNNSWNTTDHLPGFASNNNSTRHLL